MDDLAGRIIDPSNELYDKEIAEEWEVMILQAIKEETLPEFSTIEYEDPREIGEALWEIKHSAKQFRQQERQTPELYSALSQQRPNIKGGNLILESYLQVIERHKYPRIDSPVGFIIDGAWTEETKNDPSGASAFKHNKIDDTYYIENYMVGWYKPDNFIKQFEIFFNQSGGCKLSMIWVELKSSGPAIYNALKELGYNVRRIPTTLENIKGGKWQRVNSSIIPLSSGKIFLKEAPWNKLFKNECSQFPKSPHDEAVDCLCYMILIVMFFYYRNDGKKKSGHTWVHPS